MMPAVNEIMLAVSNSLAASIVAKATVTTALGLIVAWLARRNRAAVRHALLAAAFGVLLVLPIASIVAPPVHIAVTPAAQERIAPAFARVAGAMEPGASAHASVGVTPVVPRSAGLSRSALLLTGWIAGTALFLLPVVMGLWQIRSLRRSALPWRRGQLVVEGLALEAGIHRHVEVLLHGALPGPMTCGVVRPAIVLSQDAQTWEGEDLNRAPVHELEHVRRGDWVSHCLARAVCAVYWFHPLVWIAWRRLALEAERSCDDAVLGRSEATAYADQLVGLARRLSSAAKAPVAKSPLLAMANRADLAARVGAVLDSRRRRGRAGTLPVALACAAAAVLVLTLSPLRVVAAQQSAGTDVRVTPMPQFSANTMLVIADVTVSDKNGKTVEGLGANDFAVTEDGVAQHISVFEFQKLDATPGTPDSISSYYVLVYYTRNLNGCGRCCPSPARQQQRGRAFDAATFPGVDFLETRCSIATRSIRPLRQFRRGRPSLLRNLDGDSRLTANSRPKPGIEEPDPATGNYPPGLSPMAGSIQGAQIRREVFGEPEKPPGLPPKTRYFGDPFRPGSADPKAVSANWKKPPRLSPRSRYLSDPIPPLKRRSEGVSASWKTSRTTSQNELLW